jgi:hypothetical protein
MLFVLLWIAAGLVVGIAGRDRAIGFWGWFVASLVLTPVIALAVMALTAPRTSPPSPRR